MKLLSWTLLVAVALQADAANADEALAKARNCTACHTANKKLYGPTYREIAQKYANRKDAEAQIAAAIIKGTPMPSGLGWQKAGSATLPFMPPSAGVKPEEATKLTRWILSLK